MIVDRIENLPAYAGTIPYAAEIARLLHGDLAGDGRKVIEGDRCYATVSTVETHAKGVNGYETHRRYADVQVVLEGAERIDLGGDLVPRGPYQEDKDIRFFDGELRDVWHGVPGWFVVFLPGEAHEPCLAEGAPARVRKVVCKIRMEEAAV